MKTEDRIRDRLAPLERVDAPDLFTEISRRAESDPEPTLVAARRWKLGRVALALAVLVAWAVVTGGLLRLSADRKSRVAAAPRATIVLSAMDAHARSTVYLVDPDGGRYQTASQSRLGASASVSPDGTRVAYVLFGPRDRGIWVADLDGSNARRLTEATPNTDFFPTWSPDGNELLFGRNQTGHTELFIVGADGSALRQLTTNGQGGDDSPRGHPTGARSPSRGTTVGRSTSGL
jgi:dipeptidyl aminopeptidase/acylaminoacyl peptidase